MTESDQMRNMGEVATARRAMGAAARAIAGFTLIELMVVVAVVAILGAVAFPSYQNAVRKGKRGQVKADMLEISQLAERYRTINNTFTGFTLGTGFGTSPRGSTGTARNYTLALNVASGTAYTLTATPVNGQVKDTRCGTLTLNHAGQKTESGTADLAECW